MNQTRSEIFMMEQLKTISYWFFFATFVVVVVAIVAVMPDWQTPSFDYKFYKWLSIHPF